MATMRTVHVQVDALQTALDRRIRRWIHTLFAASLHTAERHAGSTRCAGLSCYGSVMCTRLSCTEHRRVIGCWGLDNQQQ